MLAKTSIVVGLALLAAVQVHGIKLKPYHESYNGFEMKAEPLLPAKERHPSLWFDESEIDELRRKKEQDETARLFWEALVGSPFILADLPPVPSLQDDKKVIHQYYGTLTQIAAYNAFLYQLGGDDEEKHLKVAVEALMRGYEGPLYDLDPIIKGSAVDEIYQGLWAQNFAAAYDWVQPALSDEEDQVIRAHLVRHARYMHENLWSWASSPHNHLSKPAWGLGSMALCLSDHPEAADWLERAIAASNANTRYFFSGDGLYREGSHYYIFSLINFLPFLYHYENVSGSDAFKVFQPAFEAPLRFRNGKGWMPNFEDSYIRPYPSHWVAGAYENASTELHSSAPLSELLQWNFFHTDYSVYDAYEVESGYNYTGATWDFTKELIDYLCYQPNISQREPDVKPSQFLESGLSVFRNDWAFENAGSRTLLFNGVPEADNHEHYDLLSFTLQAENQLMSSDSGYTRSSYGESIRRDWYLTAEAHNVALVDGKSPKEASEGLPASSRLRLVAPYFVSEQKIAGFEGGGEHRRLVAMLEGQRFVILDEVSAAKPSDLALVMHGGRGQLKIDGALNEWTYGSDTYGPTTRLRHWFWGKGAEAKQAEGEQTYLKGDYARFPYVRFEAASSESLFGLSLLDPVSSKTDFQGYHYVRKSNDAVVVRSSDEAEWLIANRKRDRIGEGFGETDAYFAWLQLDDGGVQLVSALDCAYLELSEELSIVLNAPASFSLKKEKDGSWKIRVSKLEGIEGIVKWGSREQRISFSDAATIEVR